MTWQCQVGWLIWDSNIINIQLKVEKGKKKQEGNVEKGKKSKLLVEQKWSTPKCTTRFPGPKYSPVRRPEAKESKAGKAPPIPTLIYHKNPQSLPSSINSKLKITRKVLRISFSMLCFSVRVLRWARKKNPKRERERLKKSLGGFANLKAVGS